MTSSRVSSALVLALLLVLSGHATLVGGVAIESGKNYYITLADHPLCGETAQFLKYNNNACSTHNTVALGPKPTETAWAHWVFDVKQSHSDGSYEVQIFDFWDNNDPLPAPKCQGKLSVVKPRLCKAGQGLTKVEIQNSSAQRWILRPVGSNTYQIISSVRRTGCFRYLGAAGKCGALRPALFKGDDGSGLQRWKINKVPHQQGGEQPVTPGEPTVTSSTTTTSAWEVEWTDGSAGTPEETYALKCTAGSSTSCFDSPVGPIVDNIPRGTGVGTLEGLPADTHLHCFVVALNNDGIVCSAPQPIRTQPVPPDAYGPGAPTITDSAQAGGVWKVKWTDGTAGNPEEVYSALCVNFGDSCGAIATGNSVYGVKRGVQAADVTGIPAGKYYCYVRAENVVDTACSKPQTVEVPPNPSNVAPGKPTGLIGVVAGNAWLVEWKDGSKGVPEETYSVTCGHRGAGCNDRRQGFPETGIARGVQKGRVMGLPSHTALDCFVVAENAEGRVCSDPVAVEIGRDHSPFPIPGDHAPGQPWGVSTLAVTTNSWTAQWYDGYAGEPQETYTLVCVRPGAGCHGTPAGITYNIPRGVGYGSVLGLSPDVTYECYVVAGNRAGSVCSNSLTINTSGPGPLRQPTPATQVRTIGLTSTTWTAAWVDGIPGVPVETYNLLCVPPGTGCRYGWPAGVTWGIPRGVQTGTVYGLQPQTAYDCYVDAYNVYWYTCSAGVSIVTPAVTPPPLRPPGQPTGVTGTLQVTTWAATWTDYAVAGNPEETYTVKCVNVNAGCNAPPVGSMTTGILRGVEQGSAGPLPDGAAYHCYVIAANSVSAVCSAPQTVTVGTVYVKPGKPTGVSLTAHDLVSVTLSWTDSDPIGVPREKYTVGCVAWPGGCSLPFLGTPADGIDRGVQTGTTVGLPNAHLNCYVVAYNTINFADAVCSDAVDVPALP